MAFDYLTKYTAGQNTIFMLLRLGHVHAPRDPTTFVPPIHVLVPSTQDQNNNKTSPYIYLIT